MAETATEAKLTPAQAGRLLGITPDAVRGLTARGRLHAERTPLGRLYTRADVEALRAERERPAPGAA